MNVLCMATPKARRPLTGRSGALRGVGDSDMGAGGTDGPAHRDPLCARRTWDSGCFDIFKPAVPILTLSMACKALYELAHHAMR